MGEWVCAWVGGRGEGVALPPASAQAPVVPGRGRNRVSRRVYLRRPVDTR